MEFLVPSFISYQWPRKLLALATAAIIWFFVNHSITATKTIGGVPVKIINLPTDKTIQGIQPNGFLAKRIVLTLTGTKDVIEQLEPGDVEVILDVSNQRNESILQITKKNLVSLNPNINLNKHITSVSHPELIIKMSPLLKEQIPVVIKPPIGRAPQGYEYLDIWPSTLMQTVIGPQEQVLNLKNEGIELTFNLDDITQEMLEKLQEKGTYDDEISFKVPDQWKKVVIPFQTRGPELLNDPEAKQMQINFLRKQLIPIKTELPLHVFYPLPYIDTLNPTTYALQEGPFVKMDHNVPMLSLHLFAGNVSKMFLDSVKDSLELQIVAAPRTKRERLEWGVGFIDDPHVEEAFVAAQMNNQRSVAHLTEARQREKADLFKNRFRMYQQQFQLFQSPQKPLTIESSLDDGKINLHVPDVLPSGS